jgi:hypothetical protein
MYKTVSGQLAKARLHIRYYSRNDIAEPIVDLLTSFSLSKQIFAYKLFSIKQNFADFLSFKSANFADSAKVC